MANEQMVLPNSAINTFSESVLYPFFMKALLSDEPLINLSLSMIVEGGSISYQDAMDNFIVTLQQKDNPQSSGGSAKQAHTYREKIIKAVEDRRSAYKNSEAQTDENAKKEWRHLHADIVNIFESPKISENINAFEDKKSLAFSNSSFMDRNSNAIMAGSIAALALITGVALILSGTELIIAIPLLIVSIPATFFSAATVLGKEREHSLAIQDTQKEVVADTPLPEPRSTYVTVARVLVKESTPSGKFLKKPPSPVQPEASASSKEGRPPLSETHGTLANENLPDNGTYNKPS